MPPRHIVDKLVSKFYNIFDIGASKRPFPSLRDPKLTFRLVILDRKAFVKEVRMFLIIRYLADAKKQNSMKCFGTAL
jgi:hypothetical protein